MKRNVLVSNLIWKYAERSGTQIIQFIVQIILARMLTPSDYGIIGLITVFVAISVVFTQTGLGQALVQRKEIDNIEYSSMFFLGLAMSFVLYGVMFVSAPLLAAFYNEPVITDIVRVLGLVVIIGAVTSVQQGYVQKTMQFKRFFYSSLCGLIVSAVVGISMAYMGYGVWALVGQQLSNQIVNMIVMWFTIKWRPQLAFSVRKAKRLFSYGWKLLCSSLIDTIYGNIYSLVLGKFYSTADLGFYNRGKQFPVLIVQNINTTIDSVLFPVFAEAQDEQGRLKSMMRRSMMLSTFLIFPAMAGLAAVAKPLTLFLLTDKWLSAVPFIQFCCFTYAFWPIHTANLQAIKALGRSDIFLKLEILKKLVGVFILIITLPLGLYVMMIGRCVGTVISSVINAFPNKKLLGYSYTEQIKDIFPSFLLSLAMAAVVLLIDLFEMNIILKLVVQTVTGVVVYIILSKIFKLDSLEYIILTIRSFLRKRR